MTGYRDLMDKVLYNGRTVEFAHAHRKCVKCWKDVTPENLPSTKQKEAYKEKGLCRDCSGAGW